MFRSNKNTKDSDTFSLQSISVPKAFKGGHRKTKSSVNISPSFSDLNNSDSNDLHSLTSFNSFSSLNNLRTANQNQKSSNQSWANSLESLHSLPDNLNIGSNKDSLSFYNKSKNKLKSKNIKNLKNQKHQLLPYISDKSRSNRNYTTPPPIDASTIMEDDESEQVLNVPMLPAFSAPFLPHSSNKHANLPEIPKPQSRTEIKSTFKFPPDDVKSSVVNDVEEYHFPQNTTLSHNDSESNRLAAIDQDFNVNFSKDSAMSKGQQILELRKKKGVLAHKKIITEMSSSDEDASTEHETDSENDHSYSLKRYRPSDGNDNNSIESNGSASSKKGLFKSIFRKRGLSFGSEKSVKRTTTNSSKESGNKNGNDDGRKNTGDQEYHHEYENNGVENSNSACNGVEFKNKESSFLNFGRKSSLLKERMEEFSDSNSGEKDKSTTEKQTEFDDIDLTENNSGGDDDNEKRSFHDYQDNHVFQSSTRNGEHFLKNIFHLDGLLGQGGLIPNLNLYHNQNRNNGSINPNFRRGNQVHDEENPPPDFHEEIKEEAQVLVGHMIRNPLDDLKNNKRGKNSKLKLRKTNTCTDKYINDNSSNNSTSDLNTTSGSSTGFFVPDRAHLPVDPFDDLQDLCTFSIDVPENLVPKPRKYRAGIQSALFQLYNTHTLPSISTSNSSTTLTGPNYDENMSETPYDSEINEPINDLNMNIGAEIRKTGLNDLEYNPKEALNAELPGFTSKLQEITTDAQTEVGKLSKKHKRTRSFQNKLFGSDAANRFYKTPGKSTTGNKKPDVSFLLPNFGEKPSTASDTEYERRELQGYRNLKKRARFNKKVTRETTARITVHIADVLERQRFILTLCKAFMLYGAPTHRLEEYMSMTAQVLEIDGSFIYFPGCMLVSFGDLNARTSEMKLVRCAQGLDLGKLDEVHDVYKNVVHDRLGTIEGYQTLDEIMNRKPKFNAWWCIFFYAVSSVAVASWSFGGSWIDLPICFGIGAIIGFLQFVVCPRNTLYSSVFEVTSSIIASFIARAIGSINGGNTFCYAALVQSPLALILPGYIILCGSLELQSRNIVAGSVRMFYAFIYSLMLSFGITLGAALYGWIDKNATSVTTCSSDISPWYRFLFIPMFTIGIALTNQASWSQLPMMCVISGSGYVVSYFSSLHFKQVTELNATLGCFIIGLVSNIYSRMLKSFNKYFTARGTFMTVSLMLPAIFVQVPSGIASQGSVFTGITTANNIVHSNSTTESANNSNSLSFGMVMIQVALGISVGLYLSTILVYPFGKKRTGLFTL